MSHLSVYLDQISSSCEGIDNLPFPPPRVFTNALLYNDDIIRLIRDTETHERALFSVPQRQIVGKSKDNATDTGSAVPAASSHRRQTVFNVTGGEVTTGPPSARPGVAPRRNTAVAAVLGGDLHAQINNHARGTGRAHGGDVDINILLKGAEKLCSVYALPGALERIPILRQQYAQQKNTLAYYEAKVAEQAERLEEMNRDWRDEEGENETPGFGTDLEPEAPPEEDSRRDEEEIRDLEKRKKALQERLRAMDKDLGGLRHI